MSLNAQEQGGETGGGMSSQLLAKVYDAYQQVSWGSRLDLGLRDGVELGSGLELG